MTVKRGAGILFLNEGQALFLKRGGSGDHAGEWCFPGGTHEDGETLEQTAVRECGEEIGFVPEGDRAFHTRNISAAQITGSVVGLQDGVIATETGRAGPDGSVIAPPPDAPPLVSEVVESDQVDFTTFVQRVTERFEPTLNEEHTGYAWSSVDAPPEPLHPGCRIALARLTMDELGVARAMAAGDLTSPQRYQNVTLFNIRITGTGTAFRSAHDEFVYRPPDNYLTDEFLARCNGLQVIWKHPEGSLLTGEEFTQRTIGAIFLPYILGDEVWGIAKIYDEPAIALMSDETKQLSTSPAVLVGGPKVELEDGTKLLIEGKPSLLDHLAICAVGVWDKGGAPAGVDSDLIGDLMMTEAEMKAKADADEAKVKADAEEAKAKADADDDRMGKFCDSVSKFMDSMSARMDAFEAKKADADVGDPEKLAADKARKDSEEKEAEEAKKKADADEKAKADASALAEKLADLDRRMPKERSDADFAALADAQARADGVFSAFGDSAPRPLQGETLPGYQARLAGKLKSHSKAWKDVDLSALPDPALGIAIEQIYSDAAVAARSPVDIPVGQLRPIVTTDETGRRHTKFHGRPSAWMNHFGGNRLAAAIRTKREG
jgi:8-oxo-dGTP pyrophosphatase MutT (NUDIX family)